jgi:tetratricopeptide (TPR) repeat protein
MTIARTTLFACLASALLPVSTTLAFDWGSALSPRNPVVQSAARQVINQAVSGGNGWNGGQHQTLPYCPPPKQPICVQPQPICVQPQPVRKQPVRKETPEEKAARLFASAQQSFARRDYASALTAMDQVVELEPKNLDVLQFRSLVLFAQQDYQRAAADAYDALLLGPTWTWPTISKLYNSNTATYTAHYQALSRAAKSDQYSLEKHFLLAYHHLMLGHLEHGQKELEHVLAIQPNEPVSAQLLQVVKNLRHEEAQKLAAN